MRKENETIHESLMTEQYSRRNCLRIFGIHEEPNVNIYKKIRNLAERQTVNRTLTKIIKLFMVTEKLICFRRGV